MMKELRKLYQGRYFYQPDESDLPVYIHIKKVIHATDHGFDAIANMVFYFPTYVEFETNTLLWFYSPGFERKKHMSRSDFCRVVSKLGFPLSLLNYNEHKVMRVDRKENDIFYTELL